MNISSASLGPISNVIGVLLIIIGVAILSCIPISYLYGDEELYALGVSGGASLVFGVLCWLYKFKSKENVNKREGYLIVVLAWVFMTIFGALPYYLSGVVGHGWADAIFEAMSGLTTTGASIFNDIESLPHGILLWRSLSQWLGGMGIIVLTIAIFPLLGIGGIELFVAESPGPTSTKIHPRIKETAKSLWFLYFGFTVLLGIILFLEGMNGFDALNHALTTMATGGFSTKNASIAHFNSPLIEYTITLFMFIAGTNYAVIYLMLKRKFRLSWKNDEFRFYVIGLLIITFVIWMSVYNVSNLGLEESFRSSVFQILSLVTTTGFVSADYTAWHPAITMLFFILLFTGGCAGSTSGGIKVIRHYILLVNTKLEFKRLLHPRAMIRVKFNQALVSGAVMTHILVFILIYLAVFIAGAFVLTILGIDFDTALGAVATTLGNVGPAIGKVGPVDNFEWMPDSVKLVLSFIMLVGRLELFTVLIIFTPYFWRNR